MYFTCVQFRSPARKVLTSIYPSLLLLNKYHHYFITEENELIPDIICPSSFHLGTGKPFSEPKFVGFQKPFSFCCNVMPLWDIVKYYTLDVLPSHGSNACNVLASPSNHSKSHLVYLIVCILQQSEKTGRLGNLSHKWQSQDALLGSLVSKL